jgi:hypothetical protein
MCLSSNHGHGGARTRMSTQLSQLSEHQLYALRKRLAAGVHDPALTVRGALHQDMRRCSSVSCRCRRGELHGPYTYLSVYGEGRSRTLYVPRALADIA